MSSELHFDVLVAGAGPAGIAAGCAAAESSARTCVIDDNPAPGGQIWRGDTSQRVTRLVESGANVMTSTTLIDCPSKGVAVVLRGTQSCTISWDRMVIATGARERWIPFPGWTLPNVMGAGGLQALAKGGLPIRGKRVVVAGSGPLLLAVAAYLKQHGAIVPVIAEQADFGKLMRFGMSLLAHPTKLIQAAMLQAQLAGTGYLSGCWPVRAHGKAHLESVTLFRNGRTRTVPCDYLAVGFGLVSNTELAELLGCQVNEGGVVVDEWQETTVAGVFCAGEPTGIGGVDIAIAEGVVAGYAAAGAKDKARANFRARDSVRRFAVGLNEAFALRPDLKALADDETIVCRCEDVTLGRLKARHDWRDGKLHTRCGMGPCQGRVCGPAVEWLLGWPRTSVRPPLYPVPIGSISEVRK